MKKYLIFVIGLFIIFPSFTKALVTNGENTKNIYVYVFNDGNINDNFKKILEDYVKDNYYVSIKYYSVSDSQDLYTKIKNNLQIESDKLPLIVIGTNYFLDSNNYTLNNVKGAIKAYDKVNDYCDLVDKILNEDDITICLKENENIYQNKNNLIIAITMITSLLASLGFLIIKNFKCKSTKIS